jgi:hypothetical protein
MPRLRPSSFVLASAAAVGSYALLRMRRRNTADAQTPPRPAPAPLEVESVVEPPVVREEAPEPVLEVAAEPVVEPEPAVEAGFASATEMVLAEEHVSFNTPEISEPVAEPPVVEEEAPARLLEVVAEPVVEPEPVVDTERASATEMVLAEEHTSWNTPEISELELEPEREPEQAPSPAPWWSDDMTSRPA